MFSLIIKRTGLTDMRHQVNVAFELLDEIARITQNLLDLHNKTTRECREPIKTWIEVKEKFKEK